MTGQFQEAACGRDASLSGIVPRKPCVLFVSPVADLKGGAERVLLQLLANPAVQPCLAVPEPGELSRFAERNGIPCACYHPAAMLRVHRPLRVGRMLAACADALRCALRIRDIAREWRCDLIHTNGLKAHALGAILGALWGARTLLHLHDIPYSRVERLVWRLLALPAARIVIVSRSCWPWRSVRVRVLANGVSPVSFGLVPAQLGTPIRLGFIGRYHPHKGLDRLLDWAHAARAAGLNVSLVLRGRPDPDHAEYWARIESRLGTGEFRAFVEDQGWREGAALYEDVDILVLPSDVPDPAPLVVPEAMTAGVVVVAFPAGGLPGLIPEGTGYLIDDAADFVSALRHLCNNPRLYDGIRRAAYAHARAHHDPAIQGARFAAICREALERDRTGSSGRSRKAPEVPFVASPGAVIARMAHRSILVFRNE